MIKSQCVRVITLSFDVCHSFELWVLEFVIFVLSSFRAFVIIT